MIIIKHRIVNLLIVICILQGTSVIIAEEFSLIINSSKDVDALINQKKYSEAKKLAQEKELDPRVIATILAFEGKKKESFSIFINFLQKVPESDREEFALQTVNLLKNVSEKISKELLENYITNGILEKNSIRVECRDVIDLLLLNNIEAAEKKIRKIIEKTSDITPDVKNSAIAVISRLNMLGKTDTANGIVKLLYEKFPNDLNIRSQWIDSLCTIDATKALLELDDIKQKHNEYYCKHESFLNLIRAKALEKLGEHERAIKIYESIAQSDSGYAEFAKSVVDINKKREEMKRKNLEESNKNRNKTKYETQPSSFKRFTFIMTANLIGIIVIIYLIKRKIKAQ